MSDIHEQIRALVSDSQWHSLERQIAALDARRKREEEARKKEQPEVEKVPPKPKTPKPKTPKPKTPKPRQKRRRVKPTPEEQAKIDAKISLYRRNKRYLDIRSLLTDTSCLTNLNDLGKALYKVHQETISWANGSSEERWAALTGRIFNQYIPKKVLMLYFNGLPEQDKKILHLYYFEGKTLEEVGNRLNLSRGRVRTLRDRALRWMWEKLRKIQVYQNSPSPSQLELDNLYGKPQPIERHPGFLHHIKLITEEEKVAEIWRTRTDGDGESVWSLRGVPRRKRSIFREE